VAPATRLRISLRPSRRFLAVLAAGHLAAMFAVFALDLPLWAKTGVSAVIIASAGYQISRVALLRADTSIVALELDRDGSAAFAIRGGGWQEATLLGTSFVSPVLIVLNLRVNQSRAIRHIVLMEDSADTEALRELRVLLRWGLRHAK
jgi:hypothetical protein